MPNPECQDAFAKEKVQIIPSEMEACASGTEYAGVHDVPKCMPDNASGDGSELTDKPITPEACTCGENTTASGESPKITEVLEVPPAESHIEEGTVVSETTPDVVIQEETKDKHADFDITTCTLSEWDKHMAYLVRLSNENFAKNRHKMELKLHPDCYPEPVENKMPEFTPPVWPMMIKGSARHKSRAQLAKSASGKVCVRGRQVKYTPDRTQSAGQLLHSDAGMGLI